MEHLDVVRARRMVRTYDPDRAVAPAVLGRLLDAATRAPSAGHSQGRDLLVLRGAQRDAFWSAATGPGEPDRWVTGMRTAPVLVLCLADPGRYVARYAEPDKARAAAPDDPAAWPVPWWDVDTGMAALLLLLGAVDEGLGACLFGVPADRHDAVRSAFAVPPDRRLVGVVSLGHPAPDRRSPSLRRGRRPLGDVVHDGRFATPWDGGLRPPGA